METRIKALIRIRIRSDSMTGAMVADENRFSAVSNIAGEIPSGKSEAFQEG